MQSVVQQRASAQQAAAGHQQQLALNAAKPTPGKVTGKAKVASAKFSSGSKKTGTLNRGTGSSAAGGKAAASTAAGGQQTAGSTITPYLTSTDLMGLNDAQANAEGAISAAKSDYVKTAANAFSSSGDIERNRVANVSAANDNAAGRGIYNSGIRQGNVGMANTAAARGQAGLQQTLALADQDRSVQTNNAKQALGGYLQALIGKSAENGAALPVDPYQNGASNVPGAATMKKVAGSKAKGNK